MQKINRIQPQGRTQDYKTYQVVAPKETHYRPATCQEVGCPPNERGWETVVDTSTELGQRQNAYLASGVHGRTCTQQRRGPNLVAYVFPAGQRCFRAEEHRVPLEREPLYVVRGGDWRGNPSGERRVHTRPQDWVEDFAEHQGRLADQIKEG